MDYWRSDETYGGMNAYRYWYDNAPTGLSQSEKEELAARQANFIAHYNEYVVEAANQRGVPLSPWEYNTTPNVMMVSAYINFLQKVSTSTSIAILKQKEDLSIETLAMYYCKDYIFANKGTSNVSFTKSTTATGYVISADIDYYDCGEFEGEAEPDQSPQEQDGGDAPVEP